MPISRKSMIHEVGLDNSKDRAKIPEISGGIHPRPEAKAAATGL
jgi:hypothetical protein